MSPGRGVPMRGLRRARGARPRAARSGCRRGAPRRAGRGPGGRRGRSCGTGRPKWNASTAASNDGAPWVPATVTAENVSSCPDGSRSGRCAPSVCVPDAATANGQFSAPSRSKQHKGDSRAAAEVRSNPAEPKTSEWRPLDSRRHRTYPGGELPPGGAPRSLDSDRPDRTRMRGPTPWGGACRRGDARAPSMHAPEPDADEAARSRAGADTPAPSS
jgi:hypothetical protein